MSNSSMSLAAAFMLYNDSRGLRSDRNCIVDLKIREERNRQDERRSEVKIYHHQHQMSPKIGESPIQEIG